MWMIELPALRLGVLAVHTGLFSIITIDFVEAVHVQLADETLPVVVLEKLGKDVLRELDTVVDIEHIAFFGPGD